MNQVVLLRVGVDSGCGGRQSPLFEKDSFEFVCIPDWSERSSHTYGTCKVRNGRQHSCYFPKGWEDQHVHLDPEFETFTYGDPTRNKRSLLKLKQGDLLVFYAGLQRWDDKKGWDRDDVPKLYAVGFFDVQIAGMANDFTEKERDKLFSENFHVGHKDVFKTDRNKLVLVKGTDASRLFERAHCISEVGKDRAGNAIKVLSKELRRTVFGEFSDLSAIQRSAPRWVTQDFVKSARKWVLSRK